jgi:hypothetical protein
MRDVEIGEFVAARLAEEEADARAADQRPWTYNPGKAWFPDPALANRLHAGGSELDEPKLRLYAQLGPDEYARARLGEEFVKAGGVTGIASTGPADDPQAMADARHIARQDPAATLARVEALRALVAGVADWPGDGNPDVEWIRESALRFVAAIWLGHPDYRTEWAA